MINHPTTISTRIWIAAMAALLTTSLVPVAPLQAQSNLAEARLRRMEAEIRALQQQVFPGTPGKVFSPEISAASPASPATTIPASSAINDLTGRVDALEVQIQRMTAQIEENGNRLRLIEARLAPVTTPAAEATPAASATAASATPASTPAPSPAPVVVPVATTAPAAAPAKPAATTPAPRATAATRNTAATTPARPAAPSAQRLAAVKAVVKPQTDDAGDDEYSYGFRLWEGKFYPEAQQQLKLMIDKYPRHARLSYARNLLGRAFLDDGKPREAATWFLENYNETKKPKPGPVDRAADSLLFLAESMAKLKDTNRSCIALAEFVDTYPREMAGRLKSQYDATRGAVKCD